MTIRGVFLVDGQLALDVLEQAWGDTYDIGRDDQTWWYRRKDGTGRTHTASSSGELHKLIADEHAFFPVRRAS
jgi:hypothetical protein